MMIVDGRALLSTCGIAAVALAALVLAECLPCDAEVSDGWKKYSAAADLLAQNEEFSAAEQILTLAITRYERVGELYYQRANLRASNLGRISEAIGDYTEVIKLGQGDIFKILYRRGWWLYYIGEYEFALMDFNKSLSIRSDYTKVYLDRAKTYGKLSAFDMAIKDIETYLLQSGNSKESHALADPVLDKLKLGMNDFP